MPSDEFFEFTEKYDYEKNELSHFTSLRGLFSIINSGSIRLYNLMNMNDPTGYFYALPEEYKEKLQGQKKKVYILSGCDIENMEDSEVFNLWRLYGENGFGARLILEVNKGRFKSTFLKRVIYEPLNIEQFKITKERIEDEEPAEIDFMETLITPCILHKNHLYKSENEIRLAHLCEFHEDRLSECVKPQTPYFTEYSYTSNQMCRYYNLSLNDATELMDIRIKSIELGFKHKIGGMLYNKLQTMLMSKSIGLKVSSLANAIY